MRECESKAARAKKTKHLRCLKEKLPHKSLINTSQGTETLVRNILE